MNERLDKFETMLSAVRKRYNDTVKEMEKLKSESKEKTATYRQLFAVKLETQHILTLYKIYGLIDEI